jgi:hypothetical protein
MYKLLVFLVLGVSGLFAEDPVIPLRPAVPTTAPDRSFQKSRTWWRYSAGALCLANVLDAQSSWGKRELNPNLAGTQGTFGLQGALLKMGIEGGVFGMEYLILRHRPARNLYRFLTVVNFGDAAAMGAIAGHNYTIPRR